MIQKLKPKLKPRSIASSRLDDGTLVELVYDPKHSVTRFAVGQGDAIELLDRYVLPDGSEVSPISAENNLVRHGAVTLPAAPAEYGSTLDLVKGVRDYVSRYVDLSESFLDIAASYVLFTWVYDAFNELPYLRFRGDYGCGKTRALLIVGSLCHRAFFASGASTVSPIFHTLDTFRGTLILDEADFRFSDEKAELSKILNNGNVRGFPVLRTTVTPKREFDPQAFVVFGPKLVAMRGAFEDAALESRFLTEEMGQRRVRSDIPINLPDIYQDEALALRNQLLLYRFRERQRVRLDTALVARGASHRLNQILLPLLSIIPTDEGRQAAMQAASAMESVVTAERASSVEAKLLEVIERCLASTEGPRVSLAEITQSLIARFGPDFERPITPRYVGSLIQRRLRLFTYKSHGVFVLPTSELPKVRVLCARYGVEVSATGNGPATTRGRHGDVGTFQTGPG